MWNILHSSPKTDCSANKTKQNKNQLFIFVQMIISASRVVKITPQSEVHPSAREHCRQMEAKVFTHTFFQPV